MKTCAADTITPEKELTGEHGEEETAYRLDPGRRVLTVNGKSVRLSVLQHDFIQALIEHPGRVLSRQRLADIFMGHGYTAETYQDVALNVRRKLATIGERDFILTSRGKNHGYWIKGTVANPPEQNGEFFLDHGRKRLVVEKNIIVLSLAQYALLRTLIDHPDVSFSAARIAEICAQRGEIFKPDKFNAAKREIQNKLAEIGIGNFILSKGGFGEAHGYRLAPPEAWKRMKPEGEAETSANIQHEARFSLDHEKRVLTFGAVKVRLHKGEYAFVRTLVDSRDTPLSANEIADICRSRGEFYTRNSLKTTKMELARKLESAGISGFILSRRGNRPGDGYRIAPSMFVAPEPPVPGGDFSFEST